jgi:hypothetical protein
MTAIEELLARALLLEDPVVPHDVVPCRDPAAGPAPRLHGTARTAAATGERDRAGALAARDLRTLCETVLAHTTAESLRAFVTEHLPEPPGARVLGCILHLADAQDSARSWWQYAAGAGDDLASYCLYLQHLTLGDSEAAAWWREQTRMAAVPAPPEPVAAQPLSSDVLPSEALTLTSPPTPPPTPAPVPVVPARHALFPSEVFDASFPTVLRTLTHLDRTALPRTEVVDAVMHYVPGAVALGYLDNPEFELPLPGPDFAEQIGVLLAATAASAAGAGAGAGAGAPVPGAWPSAAVRPRPRRTTSAAPCLPRLPRRSDHRGTGVIRDTRGVRDSRESPSGGAGAR